ncbi:LLM class flavin-dependent oxidoreductase [Candidatus Poriferisocius sp.]|uniref:LLM class flavin-dependent oxidoreductase n=1 Tax=Candidatus Poriferisocius sp. TaxID=3101276 RepID=UPI003B51AAB2
MAESTAPPLANGSVSLRLYPHDGPAAEQLDEVRLLARQAVEVGYDGVMVSEHHAGFPGYFPNPQQMAGFLLAAMPTGWAAPCPLLLPMKPYTLIAEEVAWLAAAFPGRVGAGFASGALPVDFELAEVPFDEIGSRFKEALPKLVAALRGEAQGPLADDRAIAACADHPVPMVAAAQSLAAVRRAAGLGLGILYDSLQAVDHVRRLSDAYDEAGGTGPKILIRRVWIGGPPGEAVDNQLDIYRSYAAQGTMARWDQGANTVLAADGVEAAEQLHSEMAATGTDTINIRIHVVGLAPDYISEQLECHEELAAHLKGLMTA